MKTIVLLKINGTTFPNPTSFDVEVEPIGRFERNANGNMVGDLIGTKVKLGCEWALLEDEFFRQIFNAVKSHFVGVEFADPHTGQVVEKEMFLTPRAGSLAFEQGNKKWWRGVKLVFVER